jgi:diaminopimelate decarboxylase
MVRTIFGELGCALAFEPGRVIAGNAGILVSAVTLIKEGTSDRFTVVDAGMNDLVRPAMYDAHHDILPVTEWRGAAPVTTDVVGPVCETGDHFAQSALLPPLGSGDLIAFMTAGAYGASMSSTYNSRPLVPEVLVNGDQFAVVRRRPSLEEMSALGQVPPWQS